jgi:hypothetical protein
MTIPRRAPREETLQDVQNSMNSLLVIHRKWLTDNGLPIEPRQALEAPAGDSHDRTNAKGSRFYAGRVA